MAATEHIFNVNENSLHLIYKRGLPRLDNFKIYLYEPILRKLRQLLNWFVL